MKKLSLNPNKTVIIPFTRKTDIRKLMEPTLFSNTIQLSNEVKYLGPMLDKGLTCKKELDKVANMAYRAFWMCRDTFGKTLGMKPKVMCWIYTMVVRPIITYADTVWWPRVNFKTSKVELSKLQRMACFGIIGTMKQLQQLQLRSSLDSAHCICSWRLGTE
jgi:hypothetical protein